MALISAFQIDSSRALIFFSQWHQRVAKANLALSLYQRERVARHWPDFITVWNPWGLIDWKPTHTSLHRSTRLASICKYLLTVILSYFFLILFKYSNINHIKRGSTWGVDVDLPCLTKKVDQVGNDQTEFVLLLSAVSMKLLSRPGHCGNHSPLSALYFLVTS